MSDEEPTLGERARALRPSGPAPRWTPPPDLRDDRSTTRALGAALGVLGTFAAALAFAFVTSRLVGGVYVTFVMPIFVGTLMAALASWGPRRFGFGDRRALIWMMVAGALVCWSGQHLMAYLRVLDIVAAQSGFGGPDAAERALALIERSTAQSGFWAYLTFVSSGPMALLSPIGYLGRLELGAGGTIIVALAELGLLGASASFSLIYRTRLLRRPPDGPVAWFDEPTADEATTALSSRRFDALPAIALRSEGRAVRTLVIEEGAVTAELTLFTVDAFGRPADRTLTKTMPLADARALRGQLALVRQRIEADNGARSAAAATTGGPDGARDA